MCVAGQLEYLQSSTADYTQNQRYDIVAMSGGNAVIRDDNGVMRQVDTSGATWNLVEFYSLTKVV